MSLKLDWKRTFPDGCIIRGIKNEDESIIFNLYCSDKEIDIAINVNNGRQTIKEQRETGLLGTLESRESVHIATCYRGLGNRAWYKVYRGVITKFCCQQTLCIQATLNKERVLDASILDKNGETIETLRFSNVFDFSIDSSRDIMALSITGINIESSHSILIDLSTVDIVEELERFGGRILSTMDHLLIYGFKEHGLTYTKVFDKKGEEVLEIEGIPYLPPYNPLPIPVHGALKFTSGSIVVADKHTVKIVSPRDYSIITIYVKIPFTRGVFYVDLEENSMISLSNLMGKVVLIKHDARGVVDWVSHILREVAYLVASRSIIVMNTKGLGGETRVYQVSGKTLIHIDSFPPNVLPIIALGDSIVLTDGRVVTRYVIE